MKKSSAKIGGRSARQKTNADIKQNILKPASPFGGVFSMFIFYGVKMMKLADKLSDQDKKKMDRLQSPKKERKMSQDEIEDLMGMHRDTYKRVHGKIRRR